METTSNRLLVPYDEARHALGGIGRTKFYELIDEGLLVRTSIGRRGFITAKSLQQYVDSLSQAGTSDPNHGDSPEAEAAAQQQVRAGFASTKVLGQQRD